MTRPAKTLLPLPLVLALALVPLGMLLGPRPGQAGRSRSGAAGSGASGDASPTTRSDHGEPRRRTRAATGRVSRVSPSAPEMVEVPAGPFTMGSSSEQLSLASAMCSREVGPRWTALCSDSPLAARLPMFHGLSWLVALGNERPRRQVWLSGFAIDRTEVTNAAWRECVNAHACLPSYRTSGDRRFDRPQQPVVGVSHRDAEAYCAWRKKRLPTDAEWEKAARGVDGRIWPWGNHWLPGRLNHGRIREVERSPDVDATDGFRFSAPVGSFPSGQSPYGAVDMAGNVAEWVADWYDGRSPPPGAVNPRGPSSGTARIVRGGSWYGARYATRSAARMVVKPEARELWIGFRCARDL